MSLATTYLGLSLKSPLVASVSPLGANLANLRRLEDAGVAAIVLPSLVQDQIEADAGTRPGRVDAYSERSPEVHSFFPAATAPCGIGPELYLDLIRRGSEAVSIPIIAGLNGSTLSGWIDYARAIDQAGAAAIELDLHPVPTDRAESGRAVKDRSVEMVSAVCSDVAVPVSVKLTPFLNSIENFALALVEEGAAGLALFHRAGPPHGDPVHGRLPDTLDQSDASEQRLPLLSTALLAGRTAASLALSTSVSSSSDVVKGLLAGADVVMTTSAQLADDIASLAELTDGLRHWMEAREIASVNEMRGLLRWQSSKARSAYSRANYLGILERYAAQAMPRFSHQFGDMAHAKEHALVH
jgi:dihydroorotate dehydrogenase (fumarate)